MQREMYADGVPMEEVKYFLRYLYEACMTACIVNLSVNALISRVGCNLNDKRFHDPTWSAISLENIMKLVMPDLYVQYNNIYLLLKSNITRAMKKELYLITAKGTLEAMIYQVDCFFK